MQALHRRDESRKAWVQGQKLELAGRREQACRRELVHKRGLGVGLGPGLELELEVGDKRGQACSRPGKVWAQGLR